MPYRARFFNPASGGGGGSPSYTLDVQEFRNSGVNWQKPANAVLVEVIVVGAGGGAQSGATAAASTVARGGAAGANGGIIIVQFLASDLPGTVAISIGAGGAGGAAVSANSTNGNTGSAGGKTSFGAYAELNGSDGASTWPSAGGSTQTDWLNLTAPVDWQYMCLGSGGSSSSSAGSSGFADLQSQTNAWDLPSPPSGGGVTASNTFNAGGNGGLYYNAGGVAIGGAAGGSPTGDQNGTAATDTQNRVVTGMLAFAFAQQPPLGYGTSGGGGASKSGANGGNGGAGVNFGVGGAGGGAARNGFSSGAGAAGRQGAIVVNTLCRA